MKTAANFQFSIVNRPSEFFEFDEVLWSEQTVEVKCGRLKASVQAVPLHPTIDSLRLVNTVDDILLVKFHQLVHYDEMKTVFKDGELQHIHDHSVEVRNYLGAISTTQFMSHVDTSDDARILIHQMIDEVESGELDSKRSATHLFYGLVQKEDIQFFDSVSRLDIDSNIGDLDEISADD